MATGLGTTTQNGLTGTLAEKISPFSGIPWWGILNVSLIGGRTGFQTPPSEWDVLRFGPNNQPFPGLCKVKRCERRMKLHRKEHPSSDFETQTFLGWSVVEFDFLQVLWTAAQLSDFQSALAYVFPGAGDPPDPQSAVSVAMVSSTQNLVNPQNATSAGTVTTQQIQQAPNVAKRPPIPVKVSHPALQMHGVDALVFVAMDGPIQLSEDRPDIFGVRFRTVQFRPSSPIQKKTLDAVQSLGTKLGALGPAGSGVLLPQYIQPAQQPQQGPSSSGGAAPPADWENHLLDPVTQ